MSKVQNSIEGYVFPCKAEAKEEVVSQWLRNNPQIGVLNCSKNGKKYYKIIDGQQVSVKELS